MDEMVAAAARRDALVVLRQAGAGLRALDDLEDFVRGIARYVADLGA